MIWNIQYNNREICKETLFLEKKKKKYNNEISFNLILIKKYL